MITLKRRFIKSLTGITLVLGIVSLLWALYDYILYNKLKVIVLGLDPLGNLEKPAEFVWLSYLYMFVFHGIAAITLIIQLRYSGKIRFTYVVILAAGILSFFGLFADWSILGDIGKEYEMGWDTSGEWPILYICLSIHVIFLIMVTGLSWAVLRSKGYIPGRETGTEKDEIVFTLAQYTGLICGLLGIAWVVTGLLFSLTVKVTPYHFLTTMIILLIPYGLIAFYWLILELRDRLTDLYDEKQWKDTVQAGFITLLILVPVMIVFYSLVNFGDRIPAGNHAWLPFFLFVALSVFSGLTLYFYRRA